jgi:glycosyltransferase involved in cell wall biosynthesis
MVLPAVTFLLLAYNDGRFIAEALDSVLAQDYPNLNILVSDDASTDDTWTIIGERVAAYGGPHRVTTVRNGQNLFQMHFRTVWSRIDTEYCVIGTGDDVFEPDRVSRLIDRHRATGATVVSSNARLIDEHGNPLGLRNPTGEPGDLSIEHFAQTAHNAVCFGAGMSWHRSVIDAFGMLRLGPRNADQVIPFRGLLLGGLSYEPAPLLRWRQHANNRTLTNQIRAAATEDEKLLIEERRVNNQVANAMAMLQDLKHHTDRTGKTEVLERVRLALLKRVMEHTQTWVQLRWEIAQRRLGIA